MRRGLRIGLRQCNSPKTGTWRRATARRSKRVGGPPTEQGLRRAPPQGNRYIGRVRPETTQWRARSVQVLERLRQGTPDSPAFGGLSGPVGRLATNHRYDDPPNCERVEDIIRYHLPGLGIAERTATARQAPSPSPGTRVCKER